MAVPPNTRVSLIARLSDAEDAAAWEEFVEIYLPLLVSACAAEGLAACGCGGAGAGSARGRVAGRAPVGAGCRARPVSRLAVSDCPQSDYQLFDAAQVSGDRQREERRDATAHEQPAANGDESAVFDLEYRREVFRMRRQRRCGGR